MEPNRIRRVARGFDLDDVIEGVEKARIGGWIVFAALSESFELDGWFAVRERDVVADDVHGESLAIARILNLRHQVEPEFGDGDVWTATSDQWSDHGLVAVHVEHEFPGECQIGAGSITDGVVELRTVDMCGAFEDTVVHIAVSTITRLDWGGRYEEALCLAGQAQHEPSTRDESSGQIRELRLDGPVSETVCGFVVRRFVDWVVVNAMNDRVDLDGFVAVPARRVLSDVVSERGDFYSRVVRHRGQARWGSPVMTWWECSLRCQKAEISSRYKVVNATRSSIWGIALLTGPKSCVGVFDPMGRLKKTCCRSPGQRYSPSPGEPTTPGHMSSCPNQMLVPSLRAPAGIREDKEART